MLAGRKRLACIGLPEVRSPVSGLEGCTIASGRNTSPAEGLAEMKTFAHFGTTRTGPRGTSISALGHHAAFPRRFCSQAVLAKSEVKPSSVFSYAWFKTVPPKSNFACIGLNQRNQRMIHIQIMKLRPLMLSNGFHNEGDRIF